MRFNQSWMNHEESSLGIKQFPEVIRVHQQEDLTALATKVMENENKRKFMHKQPSLKTLSRWKRNKR